MGKLSLTEVVFLYVKSQKLRNAAKARHMATYSAASSSWGSIHDKTSVVMGRLSLIPASLRISIVRYPCNIALLSISILRNARSARKHKAG